MPKLQIRKLFGKLAEDTGSHFPDGQVVLLGCCAKDTKWSPTKLLLDTKPQSLTFSFELDLSSHIYPRRRMIRGGLRIRRDQCKIVGIGIRGVG